MLNFISSAQSKDDGGWAMTKNFARAAVAAIIAGCIGSSAIGQTTPKVSANPQKSSQVICEKVEITGSRLSSKRVCMTRAQWADLQFQDRQAVERVQTQRGMKGE